MEAKMYNFIATTTFGLEASVKREVTALGFGDIAVQDGRVGFIGELNAIPRANIRLRSSDRVLLVMGEFDAYSFDELFEGTKALPWDEWITEDGKFTVTGKSVRSQLYSVPDCQAIVKKAVAEKLKLKYKRDWFEETGPEYKIQVAILKDRVTLTIDTTGPGLHKRGYRGTAMTAPLKETLAAALIELSYWKRERILLDPTCGSGTIPIEAAMIAKKIAPGVARSFVSEAWPRLTRQLWQDEREAARAEELKDFQPEIYASDIDPAAIDLARHNAAKAGVGDCIRFETLPLSRVRLPGAYGVAISNPPYAQRIGEFVDVEGLYRDMGRIFNADKTWSFYVLTSHEGFEKLYGRKADAKRKLFNGTIKTDYYQFYGARPGK
jgi:putative N6-adenine-specific DNA methylase